MSKAFDVGVLRNPVLTASCRNTPVQGFSVNGAENLKIEDVTIDNTAGDTEDGGHNTDCFDVGSSTGKSARLRSRTVALMFFCRSLSVRHHLSEPR